MKSYTRKINKTVKSYELANYSFIKCGWRDSNPHAEGTRS